MELTPAQLRLRQWSLEKMGEQLLNYHLSKIPAEQIHLVPEELQMELRQRSDARTRRTRLLAYLGPLNRPLCRFARRLKWRLLAASLKRGLLVSWSSRRKKLRIAVLNCSRQNILKPSPSPTPIKHA